jgi:hypothetical protein
MERSDSCVSVLRCGECGACGACGGNDRRSQGAEASGEKATQTCGNAHSDRVAGAFLHSAQVPTGRKGSAKVRQGGRSPGPRRFQSLRLTTVAARAASRSATQRVCVGLSERRTETRPCGSARWPSVPAPGAEPAPARGSCRTGSVPAGALGRVYPVARHYRTAATSSPASNTPPPTKRCCRQPGRVTAMAQAKPAGSPAWPSRQQAGVGRGVGAWRAPHGHGYAPLEKFR